MVKLKRKRRCSECDGKGKRRVPGSPHSYPGVWMPCPKCSAKLKRKRESAEALMRDLVNLMNLALNNWQGEIPSWDRDARVVRSRYERYIARRALRRSSR